MLWHGLTLAALFVLVADPGAAAPVRDSPALQPAPADTATGASDGPRQTWYLRGLTSLLARRPPDEDAALGADPRLARERFVPYAGRRIERIHVLGRPAFGTVELAAASVGEGDRLVSRAGPFERLLNTMAPPTRDGVLKHYLLFREGGRVVPTALADSERLLRRQPYIRDALIVVLPLPGPDEVVDIVVMVRDRWPWGAQASVRNADEQELAIFHRNVGGVGLNLEAELLHARRRSPADGWRTRVSLDNVGGSFVDIGVGTRHAWDRDETAVVAARPLSYPDLRLVGGWSFVHETVKDRPDLPPGRRLRTGIQDAWLGWNVFLRPTRRDADRRLRLVPAVRFQDVDVREAPLEQAPDPRAWQDFRRYLVQVHLVALDFYTTSLVFDYGETEDLPVGFWAALVGGVETGELPDRAYHGARVIWPHLMAGARYLTVDASFGGFRRGGRFEDGVLDLGLTSFSPLRRVGQGAWRHFVMARYTLGVNRQGPLALRLDDAALRDLDDASLAGNQRLVAELESVLFTPLSIAGFKLAAFGYGGVGLVAASREPLLDQRLRTNTGLGLRLNNPGLVLPTIELRVGALAVADSWQPEVSLRMGEIKFVRQRLPDAQPALLPYR